MSPTAKSHPEEVEGKPGRFVCIHAHFYQPPRENPWLEVIETQESARPWHDWNERITAECYRPNAEARILDSDGFITELVNNYEYISFNFGPTLLSWMERHAAETYEAVLAADRKSAARRSGHGNALAQAYNHIIMPLAADADKRTQIIWGMDDFSRRFGRAPEGMWLPETAVDVSVLQALAENGIRFTILSPFQARRFRASGHADWGAPLRPGEIDPTRAYRACLPGGRDITLFFYDGPISRAIAFEGMLDNGDRLRLRLMEGFSDQRRWSQLSHTATDGESYGHHHRFGEMALAYAVKRMEADPSIRLTNYGEFLSLHPPEAEVEIVENSSWSCAHGLGRWSDDCGCRLEEKAGWTQSWRKPLRKALDTLRDRTDAVFAAQGAGLFKNPWEARDEYIKVILDRETETGPFLERVCARPPDPEETVVALSLLEAQRNRMLMYTSCGWFFDDVSGIESIQLLRYAARVSGLISPFDPGARRAFLHELSHALSNRPPRLNAAELFEREIAPEITDLFRVAAHTALASIFAGAPSQEGQLMGYTISVEDHATESAGERSVAVCRMSVTSLVTTETAAMAAVTLYLGGIDLRCSVKTFPGRLAYEEIKKEISEAFRRHSITELVRRLDAFFPGDYYSLKDMFLDERLKTIETLAQKIFENQAALFETFYLKNQAFGALIREGGARLPDVLYASARFSVTRTFRGELDEMERGAFPHGLKACLEEARLWGIPMDLTEAERMFGARILQLVQAMAHTRPDHETIAMIRKLLELADELEIRARIGEAETALFRFYKGCDPAEIQTFPIGFHEIAARLGVRIPYIAPANHEGVIE